MRRATKNRKSTKNIGKDGMILDVHVSNQPPTSTRKVSNFRVITRDNNSFILTTVKGNELIGNITANYIPVAIDDRNGVAYIVSAEVIAGVATGRGEIGTFPSPSYAGVDGDLENDYKPLKNYGGDADEFPLLNGNFNSLLFNFDLDTIFDIELQNDYDRSINIIFTDGKNPIRTVNSGFSILPDNKYTIPDRSASKDTNKYSAQNFTNTLNLILKSKNLSRVEFNASENGGSLMYGGWQYFFAYATTDGNETEIFAQSMIVPVNKGDTYLTIAGSRNTGEKSSKQNRLTIYNADLSFSHIVVYCVHSDGMNGEVLTTYKINKKYYINGPEVEIVHSGFEVLTTVPLTTVQDDTINIDTASCLSQSQGHLVIANIKEKSNDETGLRDFVRDIRIGQAAKKIDIIGPELNQGTDPTLQINYNRFNELISSASKPGTDGANGGYLNPKNVHDRLGYWGGETYPFAARLFFKDGTPTKLFPCSGVDNLNGDNLTALEALSLAQLNGYAALDGWANDGNADKLANTKGIFRFPSRNKAQVSGGEAPASYTVYRIIRNTYEWSIPGNQHFLAGSSFEQIGGYDYVIMKNADWDTDPTDRTGFVDVVSYDALTYPEVLYTIPPWVDVPLSNYSNEVPIGQETYYTYNRQAIVSDAQVSVAGTTVVGSEMLTFEIVNGKKEARISIYGVTFKIPTLTAEVLDKTIGIQFFRGERNRDAIAQGLFIDSEVVPTIRYDASGSDQKLWNFAFSPTNYKLVPSFNHEFESNHSWDSYNDNGTLVRTSIESDSGNLLGIVPAKLTERSRGLSTIIPGKIPFTFLSTDAIVNPIDFSGILSKDVFVKMLFEISHRKRVKTNRYSTVFSSDSDHYSAIMPELFEFASDNKKITGKASWVPEATEEFNDLRFSSKAFFQSRLNGGSENYLLFRLNFNQYLGVVLDSQTIIPTLSAFGSGNESANYFTDQLNKLSKCSYIGNIYSGSDIRTQNGIKSIYQDLSNVQYFPISDKIYWNSAVEGADPSNTLDAMLDDDDKITLFGGDCFVNFAFRRLYINAELGDDLYNQNNRVQTGPHIGLINEANYNASFRSPETVNVTEGERKHPSQYIPIIPTIGDRYGAGNEWRSQKILEANIGNKGYGLTDGSLQYAINDSDVIYQQNHWFTRAWHSPKHIPNSFENAYRRFLPGDYQDYNPKNGEIIKLINNNGKLYCIQEKGVGIIPINERIQTGNDSAGAIYVESSGVLGPFMGTVSDEFGSRYKSSVIGTDNHVFGVDLERFTIWMTEPNQNGVNTVTTFSILSFLEQAYKGNVSKDIITLNHNVLTVWDKKNNEVIFTFYSKEVDFESERNFTVSFNEITKKFHSFLGIVPFHFFRINDDLYSFNVKADNNKFWLHDSENVPYYQFYGENQDARVSFVVNAESDINKVFENLEIISNRTKPDHINYYVQGAESTQVLVEDPTDVKVGNVKYRNESWRLAIAKVKTIHNKDIEKQETSLRAGAQSLLGVKSRLKGKYMIIELVYTDQNLAELQSILTNYQIMK